MKRKRHTAFLSPFAWTDIAFKAGEMAIASAAVIAHRTGRMASSAVPPSPRDAKEFARMGQEKIDAGLDSASAAGRYMLAAGPEMMAHSGKYMADVTHDMMALVTSRTPGEVFSRQVRLNRTLFGRTASGLSGMAAKLAGKALRPIHSRATANARRLDKVPL